MTLTHILLGVTAWTMVSVVVGLVLGTLLRQCAAVDVVPVPNEPPPGRIV